MSGITIPPEAVEAAEDAYYEALENNEPPMLAACLAMLKAWPGVATGAPWIIGVKMDAEAERLRAALEEIAAAKPQQISDTGFQQGPLSLWMWAKRTARAALEEAPQGRISEAAAQPAPPQETDNAE
jgi:hypothetical protein